MFSTASTGRTDGILRPEWSSVLTARFTAQPHTAALTAAQTGPSLTCGLHRQSVSLRFAPGRKRCFGASWDIPTERLPAGATSRSMRRVIFTAQPYQVGYTATMGRF